MVMMKSLKRTFSQCKFYKTSDIINGVAIRDAFKEMVEYEKALFAVKVNDDATYAKDATEPSYGGGPGSKVVSWEDVC